MSAKASKLSAELGEAFDYIHGAVQDAIDSDTGDRMEDLLKQFLLERDQMVAAPALLEALNATHAWLERLVDKHGEHHTGPMRALIRARKVIELATGSPP